MIPGKVKGYDINRANKVIEYTRNFLDDSAPLKNSSWKDVTKIQVNEDQLIFHKDNGQDKLKNNNQFLGFNGDKNNLSSVLIKNHNLHIDIIIDPSTQVGKNDKASISDIIVESAISTIIDNEDSVAAVDAEDKVKCYKNWLGLMKGDLSTSVEKNGKSFIRKLNPDRKYTSKNGQTINLHGRALLLNRNVGHLMTRSIHPFKGGV